ncbi:MAG: hypothetical protein IJN50_06215 [Clostridia bacterium]|nr:hypothetical protein [Clostridia bacterium]
MKKVGFVGGFDKTDLIIYVAKMLSEVGKKVLVIDTTINQRARYIVPTITPSIYYITEFDGMDVAVGFDSIDKIKDYLGLDELDYDVALIDIDSDKSFQNFDIQHADKNYFVTAFDNYSLKKGLEIVGKLEQKVEMTKVLYAKEILQEDDDYLNFLSFYYSIQWSKHIIYFPHEQGDCSAIMENQRAAKVRFRNLSLQYKEGLLMIAQQIMPEIKNNEFKKILKNI